MARARLTRKQKEQYDAIVTGDGSAWAYPNRGYWTNIHGFNGWNALIFARLFGNRKGVKLYKLQHQVFREPDAECIYQWARDIPGANVKRCQKIIVELGDVDIMKAFAMNVDGADINHLNSMVAIAEIMKL